MDYTVLKLDLQDFQKLNHSAEAPYHNNDHMSVMTDIAVTIYMKESPNFNRHELTVAIVAGMLHDYDHTAGKLADAVNIGKALAAFDRYMSWTGSGFVIDGIKDTFEDDVRQAIICTEFPFVYEPRNFVEKCLRDADILYACMTQDPELILTQLRKEIEVSRKREVTRQEMFEGQQAFLKSARLYTQSGQELWDNHAPKYLKKMEKALKA